MGFLGLFGSDLRRQRGEIALREAEVELKLLDQQAKALSVAERWLEEAERISTGDEDEADWVQMSGVEPGQPFRITDLKTLRGACRELARSRPTARGLVRTFQKYTIGKEGMLLQLHGIEEELAKTIQGRWLEWCLDHDWQKHQLEVVKRALTDGEVFTRYHLRDRELVLRFLNPDNVRDTHGQHSYGIETLPDDVETIVRYWYCPPGQTASAPIEAPEVNFLKTEVESDIKRGLPLLYVLRTAINRYDTWLQYRMALNKARAAIVLVRTHEATPGAIRDWKLRRTTSTQKDSSGKTWDRERLRPGTKIDVPAGTKYEFLSPNVQAGDVQHDGRAVLLQIAAGASLVEFMVSADASNANYASTMVAEGPAVREFELWQGTLGVYFAWDAKQWIRVEVNYGRLPQGALLARPRFEGPRIITRDPHLEAQSDEILHNNQIKSIRTWREELGLDSEEEDRRFRQEAGGEVYPPGEVEQEEEQVLEEE